MDKDMSIFWIIFIIQLFVLSGILFHNKFLKPNKIKEKHIDFELESKIQKKLAFLYHSGEIEQAIELIENQLKEHPGDFVLKFILGKLYLENNEPKKALIFLNQIKDFNKRHLPTREKIAECHIKTQNYNLAEKELEYIHKKKPKDTSILHMMFEMYEASHNISAQANIAKRILEKEPDNFYLREKLANLCFNKKEYKRAAEEYKILFNKYNEMEYAKKLAESYYELKDFKSAAPVYENLINSNSNDDSSIKKLAFIYKNMKRFDRSAELFEELLRLSPTEECMIKSNLAQLYIYLGYYDDSVELCKEILDIEPENKEIQITYTKVLCKMNDFQQAIDLMDNFLQKAPASEKKSYQNYLCKLLNNWGRNLLDEGNIREAEEKLFKALEYDDKNSDIYRNIAFLNLASKKHKEAQSNIELALSLDPKNSYLYVDLAKILKENGEAEKSLINLKKALDINPNNVEAIAFQGKMHMLQDDFQNAILSFKKVLEFDHDNIETRFELAHLYQKTGNTYEAEYELHKILELDPKNKKASKALDNIHEPAN